MLLRAIAMWTKGAPLTARPLVLGVQHRRMRPFHPRTPACTTATVIPHRCVSSGAGRDAPSLRRPVDRPAPPRPTSYVPPEEREATDPSLSFLQEDNPLQQRHKEAIAAQFERDGARPAEGQRFAPELKERPPPRRSYDDAEAARLRSTSVHAGHPLLHEDGARGATVGAGDYYAGGALPQDALAAGTRSRLRVLRRTAREEREGEEQEMLATGEVKRSGADAGTGQHRDTLFTARHEFSPLEAAAGESASGRPPTPPPWEAPGTSHGTPGGSDGPDDAAQSGLPLAKQMERDIKMLEYYDGTSKYPELLERFREKYGKSHATAPTEEQQKYSAAELAQGLERQPVDFQRTSSTLQAQLASGPHAYNPITFMQQHGVMRYQGYAFPPTTELGKLKGVDDVEGLQNAYREKGLLASVRRSVNALVGRKDPAEAYLATEGDSKGDRHIVYRTLKLDAVQRRQMRFMLTDFDYADRNTSFHVMMSYPYTDWLHVLYMVFVGWCLYQLQIRYGAYEFYDEYLGLDLRQVPSVKKPFIAIVTTLMMVFIFFQPLLVASIATNRAYRIVMRRPIGPP